MNGSTTLETAPFVRRRNILRLIKFVIGIVAAVIIARLPIPAGLTRESLTFMGIFVAFLFYLVSGTFQHHIALLLALAAVVLFKAVETPVAFSAFSGSSVWLLISAFAIGSVAVDSGLMRRIAMHVIRVFPQSHKGQALALIISNLIISPFIPSTTAKSTINAPFAGAVCEALGYEKGSKAAAGMFSASSLIGVAGGHMFFSGSLFVVIIMGLIPEEAKRPDLNWFGWLRMTSVWAILLCIFTFLCIILFQAPSKEQDAQFAKVNIGRKVLDEMGPMDKDQKIVAVIMGLTLFLWMTESFTGIPSHVVAIVAVCAYAVFGQFPVSSLRGKVAWDMVIYIGGIMSFPPMFASLGISTWLGSVISPFFQGIMSNPYLFLVLLTVVETLAFFVVPSTLTMQALFAGAVVPVAMANGIHPWVILFTVGCTCGNYILPYGNVPYLTAQGVTNNSMGEHKDHLPMTLRYMVFSTMGILASVPLWQSLGLLP